MPETIRLPLLKDHHSHPLLYAAMGCAVDLGAVDSRDEAERMIRQKADELADGQLVLVHGWRDNQFRWTINRLNGLPPVAIFNISLHDLLLNDAGREFLQQRYGDGIMRVADRDWYESHLRVVLNWFANLNASVESLQSFYQSLRKLGVGYAEEMLLVDEHEIELFQTAGLTDRTRFWAAPDTFETLSPKAQKLVTGLKLFTDGAIGARTAALREPFVEGSEATDNRGMLIYPDEELREMIEQCLTHKSALAIHAIGDRSIEQVITTLESIDDDSISRSTIRIEHTQLIDIHQARRAKDLGLVLSMQPNFSSDSVHYADRLNAKYLAGNNPFRMLIDEAGFVPGVDLIFGSDGMPHGIEYALQQSLFPAYEGQRLSIGEFKAAYCLPESDDRVAVEIDRDSEIVRLS